MVLTFYYADLVVSFPERVSSDRAWTTRLPVDGSFALDSRSVNSLTWDDKLCDPRASRHRSPRSWCVRRTVVDIFRLGQLETARATSYSVSLDALDGSIVVIQTRGASSLAQRLCRRVGISGRNV